MVLPFAVSTPRRNKTDGAGDLLGFWEACESSGLPTPNTPRTPRWAVGHHRPSSLQSARGGLGSRGGARRPFLKAYAVAEVLQKESAAQKERPAWHTAPGPATQLPSSIVARRSGRPKQDAVSSAFLWSPVRVKFHEPRSEMENGTGVFVKTLSMDIGSRSFQGSSSHLLRLARGNFVARESLWCNLIGGSFVVCKGIIVGACPPNHDLASGRNMCIAQLPAGHRPHKPMQFAVQSREAYDVGGQIAYSSGLATLIVLPDGWIYGVSGRGVEGAIDLSAVRFCIGGGISLIDEVSLHTCDVAGTRMVMLQGSLSRHVFETQCKKPLAIIPASCRPPKDVHFIVAGESPGGFHLIAVTPSAGSQSGTGGEVRWRDSIWNADAINLTGIMYEVAPDAMGHSTSSTKYGEESQKIFIADFQKFLIGRFGTFKKAWCDAFDTDGSGTINFTEFNLGCKHSGYVGNVSRLWGILDDDSSGEISLDELSMDPSQFFPKEPLSGQALELPAIKGSAT